jgi:hypothetical protein
MIWFTKEDLRRILNTAPIKIHDDELKSLFQMIGLKVKELHTGFGGKETSFELHHRRLYIIRITVNTSRSVSFHNEYINFGEEGGVHGVAVGGIDTVKELLRVLLTMFIKKLCPHYSFEIIIDEDQADKATDFLALFNEEIFAAKV